MTILASNLLRIPAELRRWPQWCLGGPDKAPRDAKNPSQYANVNDPATWADFDTAAQAAMLTGYPVGFILTAADPFTCIDLDVKDAESKDAHGNPIPPELWTTQEQFNTYYQIIERFGTYTELSRSGKGFHLWLLGNIGPGVRAHGAEIYSQERFIICTGNPVKELPIIESPDDLTRFVEYLRSLRKDERGELTDGPLEHEDAEIWRRAVQADNHNKFRQLCEGRWQDLGYPSQSEADLSLLSMLCFYSKNNEQVRRMFRQTMLGQRQKAVKDDRYLNTTLQIIRTRQAREHERQVKIDLSQQILAAEAIAQLQQRAATGQRDPLAPVHSPAAAVALAGPVAAPVAAPGPAGALPWPPGLVGRVSQFIYQSAPRPVREVAIVAALGLFAGMCGKAWHIPQSGLNMYLILVARSAIGKEAMHSGIAALIEAMRKRNPICTQFVDFNEFASGPALAKAVAVNQSFVNVSGEWGRRLKRMATDERGDSPVQSLRTIMTNLYQKSGPQSIVGGISYSNKDSNVAAVSGVAYSMIGETTPNTFYESLTESMMEDGFLSRFTVVEYTGERPAMNRNPVLEPDKALGDALNDIAVQAMTLMSRGASQLVYRTDEANAAIEAFDALCDEKINSTDDESRRQMWNRAALKLMRLAALLAVGDNYLQPVITMDHFLWAKEVIMRDIGLMSRKLDSGDIGKADHTRELKIMSLAVYYVRASDGTDPMANQGIVPRKYLASRIAQLSTFNQHKLGATAALDLGLKSLCESGYLAEMSREYAATNFGFHGKCYRILAIPDGMQ